MRPFCPAAPVAGLIIGYTLITTPLVYAVVPRR
jgi:hypothetical protein